MAEYPRGKLNADDEGALIIRMGMKDGTFILDFDKSVTWISMSREEAFYFARAIMRHCADHVVEVGEKPHDVQ